MPAICKSGRVHELERVPSVAMGALSALGSLLYYLLRLRYYYYYYYTTLHKMEGGNLTFSTTATLKQRLLSRPRLPVLLLPAPRAR